MRTLLAIIMLAAVAAYGFDAVDVWPKVVTIDKVMYYDPPVPICVKAGYRLKLAMPATPAGKRIVSTVWEQDADPARCKAKVTYEDIPAPPVIVPEILTNVPAEKCTISFTTNGDFRAIEWIDKPKTNLVPK